MAISFEIKLNALITGSKNFHWKDFLYLPKWDIYAFPTDDLVYGNLQKLAWKMDQIQYLLGVNLTLHSVFRPSAYNTLIGGSKNSYHRLGLACDFSSPQKSVMYIHGLLLPHLDRLNIRMEAGTPTWTHIDLGNVVNERYFIP